MIGYEVWLRIIKEIQLDFLLDVLVNLVCFPEQSRGKNKVTHVETLFIYRRSGVKYEKARNIICT